MSGGVEEEAVEVPYNGRNLASDDFSMARKWREMAPSVKLE